MVSFTPRPLYPQGKSPWYPLDRKKDRGYDTRNICAFRAPLRVRTQIKNCATYHSQNQDVSCYHTELGQTHSSNNNHPATQFIYTAHRLVISHVKSFDLTLSQLKPVHHMDTRSMVSYLRISFQSLPFIISLRNFCADFFLLSCVPCYYNILLLDLTTPKPCLWGI
jgi:hypothetical protein